MEAPAQATPAAGNRQGPSSVELLDRLEREALALGVREGLASQLELLRIRLTQDHYRGEVLEAELDELRARLDAQAQPEARRRWFGRRRPGAVTP